VPKELTEREVQRHVQVHIQRSLAERARLLAEVLGPQNAARLAHATESRAFVKKIVDSLRRG
jgi:hypothetical protein